MTATPLTTKSVTSIDKGAFYALNSLASATVPESVTSIGERAFYACWRLSEITFLSKTVEIYDSEETIFDATTIYGYKGSTAEAYAKKYGRTFVDLEAPEYVLGDVNDDGKVDSNDAIYLLRNTLMPNQYPLNQSGDMNGDGQKDSNDAIYLLRHTLMPNQYPLIQNIIEPSVDEGTWGAAFWRDFQKAIDANPNADSEIVVNAILELESGLAVNVGAAAPVVEGYLPGFSSDITGFKHATTLVPQIMINPPFVAYVFELDESADVKAFVKTLNDTYDLRWLVMMEAEMATIGAIDNYVLAVLSVEDMPIQ